jgi:hypothetical protein
MAEVVAPADATPPSDYVRVKRKKTTIFLYAELGVDTVHDLRAKVNLITKVPTTDIKFFIDKDGEITMDENKTLKEQQVRRWSRPLAARVHRLCVARAPRHAIHRVCACPRCRSTTMGCFTWSTGRRVRRATRRTSSTPIAPPAAEADRGLPPLRATGSDEWEEIDLDGSKAAGEGEAVAS